MSGMLVERSVKRNDVNRRFCDSFLSAGAWHCTPQVFQPSFLDPFTHGASFWTQLSRNTISNSSSADPQMLYYFMCLFYLTQM